MPDLDAKTALADALFRIGALRFGRFTLASGRQSSYYLDLRVVPSTPDVYDLAVRAYVSVARELGESSFDVIAGIATAGVTLSAPMAYVLKKPMIYVRKEDKGHGLGKLVEGAVHPGWKALLVDDVITDGGSKIPAIESLRKAGCEVSDAVVLVDRLEGGSGNLGALGVRLSPYMDIKEIVDGLFERKKLVKRDYLAVLRQVERSGP